MGLEKDLIEKARIVAESLGVEAADVSIFQMLTKPEPAPPLSQQTTTFKIVAIDTECKTAWGVGVYHSSQMALTALHYCREQAYGLNTPIKYCLFDFSGMLDI